MLVSTSLVFCGPRHRKRLVQQVPANCTSHATLIESATSTSQESKGVIPEKKVITVSGYLPPISSTTNNVSQSHVDTADDRTLKGWEAVCCWWQRLRKKFKGTPKMCSNTEIGKEKNDKPDTNVSSSLLKLVQVKLSFCRPRMRTWRWSYISAYS